MGYACMFIEMSREPQPNIKFYILAPDPDSNDLLSNLFEMIAGNCEKELEGFQVEVFVDFTRHNGLYEYPQWSLPIWAQIITKRKMTANEAMAVMNFSLLPYFTVYNKQD